MRRPVRNPWGKRHGAPRRLGPPARALAAAALVFLACLPTPVEAEELGPALLAISEILPAPSGEQSETEGEWVELAVIRGGDLGGIVLSDQDGDTDFVFPPGEAEAGELVLVANGRTPPEGAGAAARVFLASKSWWTFDNKGDDLAVFSAAGEVLDHASYGEGGAVDPSPAQLGNATPTTRAPPLGGSVGWSGGHFTSLAPTPGAANRPLQPAATTRLYAAAVFWAGGPRTLIACPKAATSPDLTLWTLEAGANRRAFHEGPVPMGACVALGDALWGPAVSATRAALGRETLSWSEGTTLKWEAGSPMRLVDPWGAAALEVNAPLGVLDNTSAPALLLPCGCASIWNVQLLSPAPAVGPPRAATGVRVVAAGGALSSELLHFVQGANLSLDANVYLFTSESIELALRAAAGRGVRVRLLVEGAPVGVSLNQTALAPDRLERLAADGVWVRSFNASGPNPSRDHAKYAVADGARVAVLTENFVGSALTDEDHNTGYGLFVESRGLACDLRTVFEWDFDLGEDRTGPLPLAPPLAEPATEPAAAQPTTALLLSPADGPAPWIGLVEGAHSTVDLETLSADAETLGPGAALGNALLRAADRGVEVRLLFSARYDGAPGTETVEVARALAAAGAGRAGRFEVRLDERESGARSELHAKVLSVDGARFILGSHNLVAAAFRDNREVSALVDDPRSTVALVELLRADFAQGVELSASLLSLEGSVALGAEDSAGGSPGRGPPAFELLFSTGGAVIAAAVGSHLRTTNRLKGAARRLFLRRPLGMPARPVQSPDGPPWSASVSDLEFSEDEPRPTEMPFELRASPPRENQMERIRRETLRPPTAFELYENR